MAWQRIDALLAELVQYPARPPARVLAAELADRRNDKRWWAARDSNPARRIKSPVLYQMS